MPLVSRVFAFIWDLEIVCLSRIEDVTHILDALRSGDPKAANDLRPLIYQELRRLAAVKMAQQAPGQTLQPTALVHEAWRRLAGQPGAGEEARFEDRRHFFHAAGEAMRHILIDRARRRQRLRHGGGKARLEFDDAIAAPERDEVLLDLDAALEALAESAPERAEVVRLRYFVSLSEVETPSATGAPAATLRSFPPSILSAPCSPRSPRPAAPKSVTTSTAATNPAASAPPRFQRISNLKFQIPK